MLGVRHTHYRNVEVTKPLLKSGMEAVYKGMQAKVDGIDLQ